MKSVSSRVCSPATAAVMSCRQRRQFSTDYTFNEKPTTRPAWGPPRGALNKMIAVGLPPWAAFSDSYDEADISRMANVSPGIFPPGRMDTDAVWLNERMRRRERVTERAEYRYSQLKHPEINNMQVWHSDALDHWIHLPAASSMGFEVEKNGGFDNFLHNNRGEHLRSVWAERARRHVLVREKEQQKNYLLDKQSTELSEQMESDFRACTTTAELKAAAKKYKLPFKHVRRYFEVSS